MDDSLVHEVAELRARIEEVDDFAGSLLAALFAVLPALLKGHPQAAAVEALLRDQAERFAELTQHPERESADMGTAGSYEAGKVLYGVLAVSGTWPGVEPAKHANATLERVRAARPAPSAKRRHR